MTQYLWNPSNPTSLKAGGVLYTPDAFGRFTLPGTVATPLLTTGDWSYWTPDDAPAFGPWVPLLAQPADASFPGFFNPDGFGVPFGLRYQTVGATQVTIGGTAGYATSDDIPTDLAPPSGLPAPLVMLPVELAPAAITTVLGSVWDVLGSQEWAPVGAYALTTGEIQLQAVVDAPFLFFPYTTWTVRTT